MPPYPAIDRLIARVSEQLAHRPRLVRMFQQCFPNTLETTVNWQEDQSAFVITGDIPAMWLRDSSAQVRPYIRLAAEDPEIRKLVAGLIRSQTRCLLHDPYANAFNAAPNGNGHQTDCTVMTPWIWERKFELDSLCYPVQLCHDYVSATGDESVLDEHVHQALHRIVKVMRTEQEHDALSSYRFERENCYLPSDTLPFGGRGTRTNFTGMVWSGFRPSDDACRFGYHIPSNMFAAVILGHLADFARDRYRDLELAAEADALRKDIEFGIETYGVVEHPRFGRIYAFETDGFGHFNLMDDANVPSLLSIPYLGYRSADDELYRHTRAFVLSPENPHYATGRFARGVGSPHTPKGYVWHIGLIMQGLTSDAPEERDALIDMLESTTNGTDYMHESFDPDDPSRFTRSWFAWANSLFGEFVCAWLESGQPNSEEAKDDDRVASN